MRNAGETEVPIPVGYVRINDQGIGYTWSSSLCKPWLAVEAAFEGQFACGSCLSTMVWGRCVGGWHGRSVQLWMPTCLLCSCQPASGPARGTKSAQLPSLVLCYLCEVCCCWTRSSFEKLNWKIWRRLMFIRNLFCHILFHFLKCSHSAWLTASWKLLFHYCPPKIGCDFMTLMKKGSIILKNVKC